VNNENKTLDFLYEYQKKLQTDHTLNNHSGIGLVGIEQLTACCFHQKLETIFSLTTKKKINFKPNLQQLHEPLIGTLYENTRTDPSDDDTNTIQVCKSFSLAQTNKNFKR
jgi:hypothetical protein